MAETTEDCASRDMTPEEFKELAKTDIKKWLTVFLGGLKNPNFEPSTAQVYDEDEDEEDQWGNTQYVKVDQADTWSQFGSTVTKLGLYIIEQHDEGGYEGAGEHAEKVLAVVDDGTGDYIVYFRITGYYSSYQGTTWSDDVTRVYPRQVMVIQWFETEEE